MNVKSIPVSLPMSRPTRRKKLISSSWVEARPNETVTKTTLAVTDPRWNWDSEWEDKTVAAVDAEDVADAEVAVVVEVIDEVVVVVVVKEAEVVDEAVDEEEVVVKVVEAVERVVDAEVAEAMSTPLTHRPFPH